MEGKDVEECEGLQHIWREKQTEATQRVMLKGKVLQLVQSLTCPRHNPDGAQLQPQKLQCEEVSEGPIRQNGNCTLEVQCLYILGHCS